MDNKSNSPEFLSEKGKKLTLSLALLLRMMSPRHDAAIATRICLSGDKAPKAIHALPSFRLTRGLWADTQRHLLQVTGICVTSVKPSKASQGETTCFWSARIPFTHCSVGCVMSCCQKPWPPESACFRFAGRYAPKIQKLCCGAIA